jgi:hypothetical protein
LPQVRRVIFKIYPRSCHQRARCFFETSRGTVPAWPQRQRPPADRDPRLWTSAVRLAQVAWRVWLGAPAQELARAGSGHHSSVSADHPASSRRSRLRRTWCGSAGSISVSPTSVFPGQWVTFKIESQDVPDSCQTAGMKPPFCASYNSGRLRHVVSPEDVSARSPSWMGRQLQPAEGRLNRWYLRLRADCRLDPADSLSASGW